MTTLGVGVQVAGRVTGEGVKEEIAIVAGTVGKGNGLMEESGSKKMMATITTTSTVATMSKVERKSQNENFILHLPNICEYSQVELQVKL